MSRVPPTRKKRARATTPAERSGRAGAFTFRGTTPFEALDPGVRKIGSALARAKQCKTAALRVITEVETRVNQVIALLADCPSPDPSRLHLVMPLFGIMGASMDSLYQPGLDRSCDHYLQNAETAKDNAERRLDHVNRILSEVNQVNDYITDSCFTEEELFIGEGVLPALVRTPRDTRQGGGLSESDKSSLQNTLSSLRNAAQREANNFDRYIEDIERFLEDYKECIQNAHEEERTVLSRTRPFKTSR